MNRRCLKRIRVAAILIACLQHAQLDAQALPRREAEKVERIVIRHVGPPAVSDELIRANIRVREGDAYSKVAVDSDVSTLYGTQYFYTIRVLQEESANGVTLVYVVQGKPLLTEIRFTGNKKYSNGKLLKKMASKVGEPLNEQRLFADSQEILKLYQKAGLQKTKVEYKPAVNEALGRGTVTFEITESPKIKVDDVVFEDAEAFKQKRLRRVIKTRRHWMFSWITGGGKLKDEVIEEDKEKLKEFYANKGYIDYDLKDFRITSGEKTNHVTLHVDAVEGTQYSVGSVTIEGNELVTDEEIELQARPFEGAPGRKPRTPGLHATPGEVFSPRELELDVEGIRDLYGSKGHIDARIDTQKNANIDKGTIDVVHKIEEGEKSYVERVDIRGNTKTKDKVIRRELAITPGETFDMGRVKQSKSILEQMQFFEKVETTDEPTTVPNRKNLIVAVEEKNTGNIAVGAGFSSIDNVVGFVEVSQGNFDLFRPPYFTGAGQKARLRAQFGSRRQDYVLTFIEPWFLGKRLELSTEVYHRDLNFLSDNYEQQQTGFRVGLRRALPHNFEAGINYTLEGVNLKLSDSYREQFKNSVILNEAGRRLVSKIGPSIAHDTRDNYLLPTRGHRAEISGELAGLGGNVNYYRWELRGSQYFSPVDVFKLEGPARDYLNGHILELSARGGVVEAYGSGDRGRDRVPLFDRNFLGGMLNMRGFRFRGVGPRDGDSREPLGGGTYWFSSAEYSIPIIDRLRFAMFYDAGMVYEGAYSFAPQRIQDSKTGRIETTRLYNDNWGVGLRLNLPIGPLRLDYGIPIHHDTRQGGGGRFQFGVGYTRDF